MPNTIEMVVSLKVPDATAITALQTLHRIGYGKISNIDRADFYKFLIDGDTNKFKEQISKVDILINANKHAYGFSIKNDTNIKILVKNIDDDLSSLLSTLKNRLGIKGIKKLEKATLWSLAINADEKGKKIIAEKAAAELLVNEHYQEFRIL